MTSGRVKQAKRFVPRAAIAALFVLCLRVEGRARAESVPELSLTWRADPNCPDGAWAEARLRDRLGRELADNAPDTLSALAHLSRGPNGFRLQLQVQGSAEGERRLDAQRCEELAEAAVLVLAIALEERAPQPAATDSHEPPAPPPESPRPEAETQPGPRGVALRADGLLDLGFLPSPSLGPQLSLAYRWPRLRAELGGYWLPPRATDADGLGNVSVSLWSLRAIGCARLWARSLFRLEACAGFELGRAVGKGLDLEAERERRWLNRAITGGLRASVQAGSLLALVLEPGLAVPLGRPSFVSATDADGSLRTLHTAAPVSFRVTLGAELRF
jgi:hypothetical protein